MSSASTNSTPDSIPLEKARDSTMLMAVIGMLSFFTVFGALGNTMVLYVYGKKRNKLASTVFIITLAGTDLITCVLIIPYTMAIEKLEYFIQYDFFCKFYMFLITSNVPFSAFIMVAIAVDRYICICHPFAHILNAKRAKMMIFLLAVVAFTLGTITALNYGVYVESIAFLNDTMNFTFQLNQTELDMSKNLENVTVAEVYRWSGFCQPNGLIFSRNFTDIYQKVYSSFFVIVLVAVLVLYIMIYRFVSLRRARRRRMRSQRSNYSSCRETTTEPSFTTRTSITRNGVKTELEKQTYGSERQKSENCRQSTIREKGLVANVRTAGMLFVVTAVFIVVFLPAWLMAHEVIPYNMLVFYMYFLYNVANPMVYAFMNKAFRRDLGDLLECKNKN